MNCRLVVEWLKSKYVRVVARGGKTLKVVINKCYGGFGLSRRAAERLEELGVRTDLDDGLAQEFNHYYPIDSLPRNDPRLVTIVEELGSEEASGRYAQLKVVEIPDDVTWGIKEHVGIEWVEERLRVW